jgi:hypothetical protein
VTTNGTNGHVCMLAVHTTQISLDRSKARSSALPRDSQEPSTAELFRVSLLDQGGPPTAARARWRPRAAAAPCLRHRSGGPHPLSAQHLQGDQPEQEATPSTPSTRTRPSAERDHTAQPSIAPVHMAHRAAAQAQLTRRTDTAQAGSTYAHDPWMKRGGGRTGLLVAHVTGGQ